MKTKISLWARLVVAFAITIGIGSLAFATSVQAADDKPAYRLQVSPSQSNIQELQPGATYHGSFSVQNTGTQAYTYITEIRPYTVIGQDYELNINDYTGYTEITDWITLENGTARIEPNTQQRVDFTISVPENAPAGSQSAALIVYLDHSAADASGVQTVSQIAHLVYANIAGETTRTAKVLENKIPSFLFNPPIVAKSVVKNTGNVYTNAIYELEVRNFFGDKLAYTNISEDHNGDKVYETRVIFPETERYNEVSWDGAPQLGLFKVKQTIRIFDETDTIEKLVFLCPIWFLVLIIIFVFVAVFWIVSRITRRKRE